MWEDGSSWCDEYGHLSKKVLSFPAQQLEQWIIVYFLASKYFPNFIRHCCLDIMNNRKKSNCSAFRCLRRKNRVLCPWDIVGVFSRWENVSRFCRLENIDSMLKLCRNVEFTMLLTFFTRDLKRNFISKICLWIIFIFSTGKKNQNYIAERYRDQYCNNNRHSNGHHDQFIIYSTVRFPCKLENK